MEARNLNFIAQACSGKLLRGSPTSMVQRISTDSRQAGRGDLFFALRGDRFDGHDFLESVVRAGASVVVMNESRVATEAAEHLESSTFGCSVSSVANPRVDLGCGVIAVDDTRRALGRLGAAYRADFPLPIIAVGGSNGKTTTKELLAAVLNQRFNTLCNETSFNNDIGVPLTLLRLEVAHAIAVLEVGTNHPGELGPLVRMINPLAGVITNIGREHLEFFKDLAGVAQEEGWLAELLPDSGKLFINGDSEWTELICQRTKAKIVRVGLGQGNDWIAKDLQMDDTGVTFSVVSPRARPRPESSTSFERPRRMDEGHSAPDPIEVAEFAGRYRVNLFGRHQVTNALLVIAAAAAFGLTPQEIRRGLLSCQPPKMRMQLWEAHGVRVLDDAYNANADSMLAALQTLHDFPCTGRRVAVLGDMAELGDHTVAAHQEVGRCAARLGVAKLITVGPMAQATAAAARAAGLSDVCELDRKSVV